jgi:hypothetical protein
LVPPERAAVVHGELVVEVVVALAHREDGGHEVVPRRVSVVVVRPAEPVREGVDAERALGVESETNGGRRGRTGD